MKSSSAQEPRLRLLLAGGGHSHALLLRQWTMTGVPDGMTVVLVNRHSTTLYSGMVPGLIAGLYPRDACSIDLRQLAAAAGVTFIQAEITGLDPEARQLHLAQRPPLGWDLLSLDVGAVTAAVTDAAAGLPIKPLEPFLDWLEAQDVDLQQGTPAHGPAGITVVGAGAAGVEVALALQARRRGRGSLRLQGRGPWPQLGSAAAGRLALQTLQAAAIRWGPPTAGSPADLTVHCTGSRAPGWLAASGLPCDPTSGRVLTAATLQVQGFPAILASGDCGLIPSAPRPASGVWAVRAAGPLARNLARLANPDRPLPLERWRPPRWALQLLGDGGAVTGHPRAMALWGPLSTPFLGSLWRLKQAIDRRFMARLQPTATGASGATAMGQGQAMAPMACCGCGAKVAAAPLDQALGQLGSGPHQPEDAQELVRQPDGSTWLQSVDGFPALVDDPWLNGRLTALHACSDLWACGASVRSAQALVSLPRQAEPLQAELLAQLLAGVTSVLEEQGAHLIGGHTLQAVGMGAERARPVVSLTVNGLAPAGQLWPKGELRPGDVLVLSRPLGSGVLFAAAMAGQAKATWIDGALALMNTSQAPLVAVLAEHGCHGCTDITGFGLLGHLGEMVDACADPAIRVELDPSALPALAGAWNCLEAGLASSLAPSNRRSWSRLEPGGRIRPLVPPTPLQAELMVDPQTCGPLLAAIPEHQLEPLRLALGDRGLGKAWAIGRVVAG